MPFYVHAQDRPGTADALEDLSEDHWSYMDRFDDRLILRGPTLTDDGVDHTGSVHVVDLADRADAERFATEEPFWRAGLYSGVSTVRAVVLLDRRPSGHSRPDDEEANSLVTGDWSPVARSADAADATTGADTDDRLEFAAVLVDDDQAHTTGFVAVVRSLPDEAVEIVRPLADRFAGGAAQLAAQRWCRGGRS